MSGQEVICMDPKPQSTSMQQMREKPRNSQSKASPAPPSPWKTIAVLLGILCLLLVGATRALSAKFFQDSNPHGSQGNCTHQESSTLHQKITGYQKAYTTTRGDKTSSCPEKWEPHGHFCYLFTNDWKSWQESKDYCTSLDSKLLDIKNKEELEFFKSVLHVPHWIGLSRQAGNESWLWEDGTALFKDLFVVVQENTLGCCVLLSKVETKCVSCEEPYSWICKKEAVHPEPAALAEGRKKSH
ncbi:natural killer cells antigen CD94-like [Alligator sinensis]|uniref:Natural killer cells antigen CD94-like n=1 Tax=Alligator sinensis TaxID=38654 RepID=A0A3Q0H6K7_ALLSI|nr:natural killer cells antigen CD94-like [Alligator sinensis]XP_025067261.1 natural killer cells antigen CD94-like [Alligator sinensis]XP_025067262.1 natural killer cells antigen CD94-like [Alligator sinensis]XP_025067263.1 natural killer cells antigen CD94-like [Alligator sinensis]